MLEYADVEQCAIANNWVIGDKRHLHKALVSALTPIPGQKQGAGKTRTVGTLEQ